MSTEPLTAASQTLLTALREDKDPGVRDAYRVVVRHLSLIEAAARAKEPGASACGCTPDNIDVSHHFPYAASPVAPAEPRLNVDEATLFLQTIAPHLQRDRDRAEAIVRRYLEGDTVADPLTQESRS